MADHKQSSVADTVSDSPKHKSSKSRTSTNSSKSNKEVDTAKSAQASSSSNQKILDLLQSMRSAMDQQSKSIDSLNDRMSSIENYEYADPHFEDYYDDGACADVAPPESDDTHPGIVGCKRPSDTPSRFDDMAKKFRTCEHVDSDIDDALATNITQLFRNGISDERYNELIKDDLNARPANCEGLVVSKTNRLIWDAVSHNTRLNDKKLQSVATSIIKASTILAKTVNDMAKVEEVCQQVTPFIENGNNVLALLGQANRQLNLTRRDFMRPDLREDYAHLCNHSSPFTSELFGDDVGKKAREIEDCNKIGNRLQRSFVSGQRSRSGFGFRPRMRGRGRVGYTQTSGPFRGRSSYGYYPLGHSQSKNLPRRGGLSRGQKM